MRNAYLLIRKCDTDFEVKGFALLEEVQYQDMNELANKWRLFSN